MEFTKGLFGKRTRQNVSNLVVNFIAVLEGILFSWLVRLKTKKFSMAVIWCRVLRACLCPVLPCSSFREPKYSPGFNNLVNSRNCLTFSTGTHQTQRWYRTLYRLSAFSPFWYVKWPIYLIIWLSSCWRCPVCFGIHAYRSYFSGLVGINLDDPPGYCAGRAHGSVVLEVYSNSFLA